MQVKGYRRARNSAWTRVATLVVLLLLVAPTCFHALPGAALHAQEHRAGKVYRIGFLRAGPPPKAWLEAFQQGLRERGYVEGQNVIVELRFTDGSLERLPDLAKELVGLKVDVVVASAGAAAVAVAKAVTSVPVVFVGLYDPVEMGLVSSLGHPGGNLTGLAVSSGDLAGKRLELLRGIVPKLRRVAVLSHPANAANAIQLKGAEVAARTLGMQLHPVSVQGPPDLDSAFQAARGSDGLLQVDSVLFTTHRALIAELAAKSRLPAIYTLSDYAEVGGLMSYGPDFPDLYRRGATHVDKVLKGMRPGDLAVEQPTKFEFVINVTTAKALGLTIPPSLLVRADRVID